MVRYRLGEGSRETVLRLGYVRDNAIHGAPVLAHLAPSLSVTGAPVSKNPESVQHLSQDSAATVPNQPNRSSNYLYSMMMMDGVKSRSRHSHTTSSENQVFGHFFGVGHFLPKVYKVYKSVQRRGHVESGPNRRGMYNWCALSKYNFS